MCIDWYLGFRCNKDHHWHRGLERCSKADYRSSKADCGSIRVEIEDWEDKCLHCRHGVPYSTDFSFMVKKPSRKP